MTFKTKITKTYHYVGFPQAKYVYSIESDYFVGTITMYGNQGFDIPELKPKSQKNNGYFWTIHRFLKEFYSNKSQIEKLMFSLKPNERKEIILEY